MKDIELPEPLGYMNAGHVHELQQGRLHYGYVYPKGGIGAEEAVYTADQLRAAVEVNSVPDARIAELERELEEARKDAERWKTHVEVVGDHSHKCKKCLFEYTPDDCGAEDCPRCGFDGIDAAIKEQT